MTVFHFRARTAQILIASTLVLLPAALCLAPAVAAEAAAGQVPPGCDQRATAACITDPEVGGDSGPSATPTPLPIALTVPVPNGQPPAPQPAPALGVYGTINRGNAAYADALQNLSTAGLGSYFSGGALAQIQRSIDNLFYRGAYATPTLLSTYVRYSYRESSSRWVVQTMEHWHYQEWSIYGYLAVDQDQWVLNTYTLERSGSHWSIIRDETTPQ